jgi:hypothetical protein
MLKGKKVLVVCLANPSTNPRPRRIIEFFAEQQSVVDVFSYSSNGDLPIRKAFVIKAPSTKLWIRVFRVIVRVLRELVFFFPLKIAINDWLIGLRAIENIGAEQYDFIVVENLEALPFASRIRASAKLICDLREFYPLEFEGSFLFNLIESRTKTDLCKKFLPSCDLLISVSPGLVQGYKDYFNLNVELIRSVPRAREISVRNDDLAVIKMVHHGNANRDRKLESMITMFDWLDDRFCLDFYLTGDVTYQNELRELAKANPRIQFKSPVKFEHIIPMLNNYDIGLYLLQPTGYNTKYSLPNKFFEFIQARLVVAIGPSPDMASIINHYQCGIISSSFESRDMAGSLMKLSSEEILKLKANSDRAGKDLCFEEESKKLAVLLEPLSS